MKYSGCRQLGQLSLNLQNFVVCDNNSSLESTHTAICVTRQEAKFMNLFNHLDTVIDGPT